MSIFLSATLPLFIYFGIDFFFEFHIAIILTVVYGILEFTFFYIKDKRVDKLILIATILVVAMGAISYAFDNEAFFKLKPAIMQLLGVAFLMYFVITKKSIFDIMKDRMPKNMKEIPEDRKEMMQVMVRDMAIMLFLHTFLIVYAAYYLSTAAWTFISGILPYILMFILMFYEVMIMKKKMQKEYMEEMNNSVMGIQVKPNEVISDYKKGSIRDRKK